MRVRVRVRLGMRGWVDEMQEIIGTQIDNAGSLWGAFLGKTWMFFFFAGQKCHQTFGGLSVILQGRHQ